MSREELEMWRAQVDKDWEERQRKSRKLRRIMNVLIVVWLVLYAALIVGIILDGESRK